MKKIIICSIIILLIMAFCNTSLAVNNANLRIIEKTKVATVVGLLDPEDYEPGGADEALNQAGRLTDFAKTIITLIRVIGVIVTVITLLILGIKYMTASVSERADYKKSMIPYLIGVFIFFALSQLVPIIMEMADKFNDL